MRFIRQLLSALLGAAIIAAALLGAVAPASAHDAAESTSPASGATVAMPPEQVSVTFNKNPLALGSQILVNDAAGTNWSDGAVEIVDNVASQKLKAGAPAGAYTVVWRVVSSDSHPIEGSFTFTATAGTTGSTAARRGSHDGNRPAGHHARAVAAGQRRGAVPVEHCDLCGNGHRHPGGPGPDGQEPAQIGLRQRHQELNEKQRGVSYGPPFDGP